MKNLVKVLRLTCVALSLVVLGACGDDEKPANRITVDGEGYKFSNAYVITQTTTNDDDEDGYIHIVYLTGEGLTIDADALDFDGDGNVAILYLLSEDEELTAGTYTLKDEADADFGDAATFVLATSFNGSTFDDAFQGKSGSIKVSKSGSKYTFKLNFDEYLVGADDEAEEGEGSIKGYFNGSVEVVDASDDDTAKFQKSTSPFAL